MTNETKPIWQSMTFWGGIIAAIPAFARLFGFEVAPEDLDDGIFDKPN